MGAKSTECFISNFGGRSADNYNMKVLLAVMICLFIAAPLQAETLSVSRKIEIPLYQNTSMTRSVIMGAASGLATGVGVGLALRQAMCRDGNCPKAAKTFVPSILLGSMLGAGIGALVRKVVDSDSKFVVYPTVGVGSYGSAPGLMFEGCF